MRKVKSTPGGVKEPQTLCLQATESTLKSVIRTFVELVVRFNICSEVKELEFRSRSESESEKGV